MSKRDKGASIEYYLERGYAPEAVAIICACSAGRPKTTGKRSPLEEIIRIFDLKHVWRSHATFDPEKLHWLNGEYARELSDSEFYDLAVARLKSSGVGIDDYQESNTSARRCKRAKARSTPLTRLPSYCGFYFTDDFNYNPEAGDVKHFTAAEQAAAQNRSRRVGCAGEIRRHANRGNVQSHSRPILA